MAENAEALFIFLIEPGERIMSDNEMKEVNFEAYCKSCEFEKREEYEDPCNECLENPCREGTIKPFNYKEKERK